MGAIEDIRKVIQDLVTPNLKAPAERLHANDKSNKLRDEMLSEKISSLRELT
jgi:hypothetical protein